MDIRHSAKALLLIGLLAACGGYGDGGGAYDGSDEDSGPTGPANPENPQAPSDDSPSDGTGDPGY